MSVVVMKESEFMEVREQGRDGSRETEAQGKEGSWVSLCISE